MLHSTLLYLSPQTQAHLLKMSHLQHFQVRPHFQPLPKRLNSADSWASVCRGVICLVRIVDGEVVKGDKVTSISSGMNHDVLEVKTFLNLPD